MDTLRAERRVRLETLGGQQIDGTILSAAIDTITLRHLHYRNVQDVIAESLAIPVDSIARIWVSAGTRWKTGALVGASVMGVALVLLRRVAPEENDCDAACFGGTALVGATVGAVAGAAIGSLILRWRLVF